MSDLRVLFYDLETAPLLAHIWHPTDQYVTHERLIHDSFLLTWSAKWRGEKDVLTGVLTGREAKKQDDSRIVKSLAALIREADVIVAHNAKGFDVPMFNNRLLKLRQPPLPPVSVIDTLSLAKKNFRLAYNKLDYLADFLFGEHKIKTDFALWQDCYHGDEVALDKMSKYNVKDVILLEKVFEVLRPYAKQLTRLVEPTGTSDFACPSCASQNLQKRGLYRTQASTFQRYECKACGRYSRSRTAEKKKFAVHPL